MILIIGGAASGKLDYVKSLGYTDQQIADGVLDQRPVLANLQDIVATDPANAVDLLDQLLEKQAITCDEVGSGVIPAQREQREAREQTGRLCVLLAQQATQVVRLVAGIPTVIKG